MSTRNYTEIFCELKTKTRNGTKNKSKKSFIQSVNAIPWNEAFQTRPPLRIDMSGPTPMEYNIIDKEISNFNKSPAYSFGRKCTNLVTSADGYSVSPFIIQTENLINNKKPSPAAYEPAQAIGHGQFCYTSAPAFSIGPAGKEGESDLFFGQNLKKRSAGGAHTRNLRRPSTRNGRSSQSQRNIENEDDSNDSRNDNIENKNSQTDRTMIRNVFGLMPKTSLSKMDKIERKREDAGRLYLRSYTANKNPNNCTNDPNDPFYSQKSNNFNKGPSATTYTPTKSEHLTQKRAPACSMAKRINNTGFLGNAQRAAREVPACNIYNPNMSLNVVKYTAAKHKICGMRRFKRHDTGPFATL